MTEGQPADATSRAEPGSEPEGAPAQPAGPAGGQASNAELQFEAEGKSWIARVAGKGAAGTGAYGLGLIEAVHFFAAEAPDRPIREALIARSRFGGLYEAELADLLARATPIVVPETD